MMPRHYSALMISRFVVHFIFYAINNNKNFLYGEYLISIIKHIVYINVYSLKGTLIVDSTKDITMISIAHRSKLK